MTTRITLGCAAMGAASVIPSLLFHTDATAALPLCGGNQRIQIAPVNCSNTKVIDGTAVTVVLSVTAGGAATAAYTLGAPRAADTPIRVRSHRGISSAPTVNEAAGVIPAGTTTSSLSVPILCGQIDTKAVYVGDGDARGRVAAPYVTTATDCQAAPVTTTIPRSTSSVPVQSSLPGPTVPEVPAAPPLSSTPGTITRTQLPATGTEAGVVFLGAVLVLCVGVVLWRSGRRPQ